MSQEEKRVMSPDHPRWDLFTYYLSDICFDCGNKLADGTCCDKPCLDATQVILQSFWDVDVEASLDYLRATYSNCDHLLAEKIISDKNYDHSWSRRSYKRLMNMYSNFRDYYVAGMEKGTPPEQTMLEVKEIANHVAEYHYEYPELVELVYNAMKKNRSMH